MHPGLPADVSPRGPPPSLPAVPLGDDAAISAQAQLERSYEADCAAPVGSAQPLSLGDAIVGGRMDVTLLGTFLESTFGPADDEAAGDVASSIPLATRFWAAVYMHASEDSGVDQVSNVVAASPTVSSLPPPPGFCLTVGI